MSKDKPFSWNILPKALIESVLIVMSILLALGLDQMQEDQEKQELIDRSLHNFANELSRNRATIEDVSLYHRGVWQVLDNRNNNQVGSSVVEFRNIMDAMQAVVLTRGAWETAVATGALGRMDFELVSALSLTYDAQSRFNDMYNSTLQSLLTPSNLSEQNIEITAHNAARFVADVTTRELELSAYYSQTLELLNSTNVQADKMFGSAEAGISAR